MVTLNHAVAVAMVHGPSAGLKLLARLDGDERINAHHRPAAVGAHLLEMSGERAGPVEQYRLAASRATNVAERTYLVTQAARLGEQPA